MQTRCEIHWRWVERSWRAVDAFTGFLEQRGRRCIGICLSCERHCVPASARAEIVRRCDGCGGRTGLGFEEVILLGRGSERAGVALSLEYYEKWDEADGRVVQGFGIAAV